MASPLITILKILNYYTDAILLALGSFSVFILVRYSVVQVMLQHLSVLVPIGMGLAIFSLLFFWWYRYYIRGGNRRCTSHISLKGKTVIITGGNSGIGKGAAIELATRGARVIIACRNVQKAEEAVKEIKDRSGNENVVFRKLELSSFKSVREFADRIKQEEGRLDILINNAGIPDTNTHDEELKPLPTEDGLSQSFQINHFSHFLLTNLLLDLLKKSAPSRVINVTSRLNTAPRRKLDFTEGDGDVRYPKLTFYTRGKLANVLFTKELAVRMEGTGVTSYAVDPGIIFTNIWEKQIARWKLMAMSALFWLLFCDEISGAQTTVHCAIADGLKSGYVYFDCRPSKHVNHMVNDEDLRKQLWDVSLKVTN